MYTTPTLFLVLFQPLVNGDEGDSNPTSALHEMEENQENKPPPESQE